MGELVMPVININNVLMYCCPVLPALEAKFIVQSVLKELTMLILIQLIIRWC